MPLGTPPLPSVMPTPARLTRAVATAAALLASAATSHAQIAYDGVNARVEVLGLRRWTLRMLQDSVAHYAQGATLESAACMVILRDSLHFADAAVESFTNWQPAGSPERKYLVIKVVEPSSRGRVRWTAARPDSFTTLQPAVAPLVMPLSKPDGSVNVTRLLFPLQFYARDSVARARVLGNERTRDDAIRLWTFLDAHRSDSDRVAAMRTLRNDATPINRMAEVMELANFTERDSTWYALAEALRDPHHWVRNAAAMVVGNARTHRIDWGPAAPTLRLLVNGTNVDAMTTVFHMLAKTEIAPSLAAPLLRNDGAWVLEHLRAELADSRTTAHQLLVQLNGGRDLGDTAAPWARWIRTL